MTNNVAQMQPLVLDGQNHRTTSISYSGSPTHARKPSITSPGLEALANAASNTAPIPSPTQHSGSFAHATPFQPTYSHFASRPSSSHTTLPPLSNDYNHAHGLHNASHNTSLGQYHHQSNGERRLSNVTESATQLPPLHQSPTDQHLTFSSDATQPLNGIVDYANGNIPNHPTHETSVTERGVVGLETDQSASAPATSQIRQPSPGPLPLLSNSTIPETQGDQVEVKAEVAENPSEIAMVGRRPSGQVTEEVGTPSKSIESPAPLNGYNAVGATPKPKAPPGKKRAAPKKGTASAIKPAAKKRKLDTEILEGTPGAQRSGTPATSRASNTPLPKNRKQDSATPVRSSSVVGPEDEDGSEEDTEAYCICRKPDDHTLMIGCDGPCEDWFHVRCVSMDSVKAKLISKWYCKSGRSKNTSTGNFIGSADCLCRPKLRGERL